MSELSAFQDAFTEALSGQGEGLARWIDPGGEARVAVYRNTVAKGCADALAAQFPTVERVVGEAWMREAALSYAALERPSVPSLSDYGDGFPAWLSTFAPAAEMPFLAGLARIDWARRHALFAADRQALQAADFAKLTPDDYGRVGAQLHPSAQLLWFEDGMPGLWVALQGEEPPAAAELGADPQGLLLVRPDLVVRHHLLGRGAHAFLDACQAGLTLAEAGERALDAEPGLSLAELFSRLIAAGAFAGVTGRRLPTYHDHKTPHSKAEAP